MNPFTAIHPMLHAPAGDAQSGGGTAGTIAQAKQTIKRTAHDAASTIKSAASDTTARFKVEAEKVVSEKRETAAGRIDDYSSAIHDSARSFEEKDPNIAYFTHRAADRLQGVADYVRTSDFAALRNDAEDIARRRPAAFFGGMFLAGLILGNVVKARSRAKSDEGSEWEPERQSDFDPAEDDSLGFPAAGSSPAPGPGP